MSNDVRKRRVLQALVYGGIGTFIGLLFWSFLVFILGDDNNDLILFKLFLPGFVSAYIALAIHARDEDP